MSVSLPSPLPASDRALLRVAGVIVPPAVRGDWLRCWQAELWHRRHPRSGRSHSAVDLYPGLFGDSVWLRTHIWNKALSGTALLCVLLLGIVLLVSLLPLWTCLGSMHKVWEFACGSLVRFVCEAGLVTLVGSATSSRAIEYTAGASQRWRWRTHLFQAAKVLLVLLIAFIFSEDLTLPLYGAHRFTAEVLQPQLFVLMALLSLRWSFQDGENRCKHCLRSLSAPARVGRPSWNFLDSNGTERLCRDGHGLLSIPEIETSWRSSSHWIAT